MTAPLRRVIGRLAAADPAPVFVAVGAGARDRAEALALRREVRLVSSARHATVLLVAGEVSPRLAEPLKRVHDQLPHPRGTIYWGGGPLAGGAPGGPLPAPKTIAADADPVAGVVALHRSLVWGNGDSETHVLPDEPPNPWRGRGDHGQGGEGMMGGTPYGRPMAMTAQDIRDGLALDRLELSVGPFFPAFPPGLVLDVALQGDVVQEAEVLNPPFAQPVPEVFERVLREPVPVGEMEEARGRVLLRRIARVLRSVGAHAGADAALSAAVMPDIAALPLRRLRLLVRQAAMLGLPWPSDGGPRRVRGRMDGWLEEAERAWARARRAAAGDLTGPVQRLGDLGPPFADDGDAAEAMERLPGMLIGLEWGEMVLSVAALDPVPNPQSARAR